MAAIVSELGFNGSKGSAFSAATRTINKRKASDTVSPMFFLSGGGLSLGAFVNTGANNGSVGHRNTFLLSYIVAQSGLATR